VGGGGGGGGGFFFFFFFFFNLVFFWFLFFCCFFDNVAAGYRGAGPSQRLCNRAHSLPWARELHNDSLHDGAPEGPGTFCRSSRASPVWGKKLVKRRPRLWQGTGRLNFAAPF